MEPNLYTQPPKCKYCSRQHFTLKVCPEKNRKKPYQKREFLVGSPKKRAYDAVHKWASRHMTKKGSCELCGNEGKTHWSNKDQLYTRDKERWQELCAKCHWQYDKTVHGKCRGKTVLDD